MIPLIIAAIVVFAIAAVILGGPTKENETVDRVRERLQREEEIATRKRKNEEEARELEVERKRVQEMESSQRRREELVMRMMEQAKTKQQGAKVRADRKAQDEDKRNKKEEERVARQKNEEETRELARRMEELKVREQRHEEEVEKARQIAERERLTRVAEKQFGPLRWPTREELQHALQATQYDHRNFHFAVVGRAGSGKSSLINAFRNLRNKDPGAAPTGTKETTLETGRYEDPGDQPPRKWMVWYDVPGAGTQRIPHYDYFIKQGLFVFDLIVLAIGDRFEEIDVRILENCARFNIPAFIVRSKADMHILNSMKEYGDYEGISDDPTRYAECRDTFVMQTQETVTEGLVRQGLPDQPVYIVSRDELKRTYNNSLESSRLSVVSRKPGYNLIHESHLVKELLTAAARRRCETSTEQTPLDWVKEKYSALQEQFSNFNCGNLGLADSVTVHHESQPSRTTAPAVSGTQKQPANQPTRGIRKVIYPKQPTGAQELYDEMAQNDPELPNMLVGWPSMFNPQVAMLTFYPLAPIPTRIYAFGGWLQVTEYREKGKEDKVRKGRGGHIPIVEAKQTAGEGRKNNPAPARGRAHLNRGRRGSGRGGPRQLSAWDIESATDIDLWEPSQSFF